MSHERHVIKGRGPNRGKYLCYARMDPSQKASADGFIWLSDQRKAARWENPKYNRHSWSTERARVHNGYFVELIAPKDIIGIVPSLKAYIDQHAAGAERALPCHWFGGDFHDAGEDFCWNCATEIVDKKYAADPKRFEELYGECEDEEDRHNTAIDGGWDTEHDSPPFCETCGRKLSGNLTDYGSDEEIEALTTDCAPTFDDVEGWAALDLAITNIDDDDPRWRRIAKVVKRAHAAEQKQRDHEASLTASPGMMEARCELLSIFQARAVQKAPEPSFALWSEFLAWRKLSFEERDRSPEARALEKRLIPAANSFASCLGFPAYWQNGSFIIKAPYGEYYWLFIVEIEQWRLWNLPAFQEGAAYALHPPPGDNRYRGANPYPEGDERHDHWDAGYIGALGR